MATIGTAKVKNERDIPDVPKDAPSEEPINVPKGMACFKLNHPGGLSISLGHKLVSFINGILMVSEEDAKLVRKHAARGNWTEVK